jgi:RNA polymerase sigma factor (sigma-70 family)
MYSSKARGEHEARYAVERRSGCSFRKGGIMLPPYRRNYRHPIYYSDESALDKALQDSSPEDRHSCLEDALEWEKGRAEREAREIRREEEAARRQKKAREKLRALFRLIVQRLRNQKAEREAQVFAMRYLDHLRPRQIAKRLNLTQEAVRVALFRARGKADAMLVEQGSGPLPRRGGGE